MFHSLENFEICHKQCAECYAVCMFQEISAKRITSTSDTWLSFSYCQTIRCRLFIAFNVVDLMWCSSGCFWSCSRIQHRVLFFSPSLFYFPERIKSTSTFREQLFSVPHPKTSRLPQFHTENLRFLLTAMAAKIESFYILQRNSNSPIFYFDSLCSDFILQSKKIRNCIIFWRRTIPKLILNLVCRMLIGMTSTD